MSPGAGGTVAAEGATYSNPARIPYKFSMTANVRGYHKVLSVTSVYEKLKMEIKDDESAEVSTVTTLLCCRKDVFMTPPAFAILLVSHNLGSFCSRKLKFCILLTQTLTNSVLEFEGLGLGK